MAAPILTDINGGLAGSGTVGSLFIIDGNNFGDLSSLPSAVYSADFRDASTNNLLASAAVNFAIGDWQNILIVGNVPGTLASSTTYKVTVTTPSGTSAPLNFRVVGSVSFSPSTISWTATASLPTAQQGFPTVIVPITGASGGTGADYTQPRGGEPPPPGAHNHKNTHRAPRPLHHISQPPGGGLSHA